MYLAMLRLSIVELNYIYRWRLGCCRENTSLDYGVGVEFGVGKWMGPKEIA